MDYWLVKRSDQVTRCELLILELGPPFPLLNGSNSDS